MEVAGDGGGGWMKKVKGQVQIAVTKQSQGYKVHHREDNNTLIIMYNIFKKLCIITFLKNNTCGQLKKIISL